MPVELLARSRRIHPVHERDKRKALSPLCVPVLCEEDSGNSAEPLKEIAKFLFFSHLRDLGQLISNPLPHQKHQRKTHIRNPQSRQIIPLELASHPLSPTRGRSLPHMRRHITTPTNTEATGRLLRVVLRHRVRHATTPLVRRRHGILIRTPGSEMLTLTDPTLHLLVLELLLETFLLCLAASRLRFFSLYVLPVAAGPELDVLADARGVALRALGFALLEPEFGPGFALGHRRAFFYPVDRRANLASCFDLLARVVESIRYGCLCTVFVYGCGRRGEGVGVRDIVGPVWAAAVRC